VPLDHGRELPARGTPVSDDRREPWAQSTWGVEGRQTTRGRIPGRRGQYDANSNLSQVTDRKSQVITFTYDGLDRRTVATYPGPGTVTTTYDAGNRVTQVVDTAAGTITRTYDGLDRLTQEGTPQGTVNYTYDVASRRATMTVAGQSAVSYTYDTADRLTQVAQGSQTVGLAYDDANRRSTLTLPNGVVLTYAYDAASRLTGLTYTLGAATLGTLTYTPDAAGNRTALGGSWARTNLPATVHCCGYS
jgi:YD repeat-containing protein